MNILLKNKTSNSIISGILIGLSYPPFPLGFFAWFGFIPLFISIKNCSDIKESFKCGYLAGITSHFIALYWIGFNSGAGFVPVFLSLIGAVFYLALFWGIFSLTLHMLINFKKIFFWIAPFVWISMEWVRSFGSLGFPWMDLSLTQSRYTTMIQLLDVTGGAGIALWILFLNLFIYYFIYNVSNRYSYAIFSILLLLLIWINGNQKIKKFENEQFQKSIDVVVTQPSVDPNKKWERQYRDKTFDLMYELLDKGIEFNPDLIIWPETALPSYLRLADKDRNPLQKKVNEFQIPLFSGTIDRDITKTGKQKYFNGSIFLQPDRPPEMYHKVKLVPFAEYVPLSGYFPQLNEFNFGQGNFTAGLEYTLFKSENFSFSNLICFESSLPEIVRKFVLTGAEFLIIQANDGWLGNTSGPYQHFELAKLRAVENRRSVVRSANTGISGIILPSGKVIHKKPIGKRAVFKGNVPMFDKLTFYSKFGNILGKYSTFLIIFCIGAILWLKKI